MFLDSILTVYHHTCSHKWQHHVLVHQIEYDMSADQKRYCAWTPWDVESYTFAAQQLIGAQPTEGDLRSRIWSNI